MTDPKRITLPGPGSRPSHPAPEPPLDPMATAVLGTLPSGTPVQRSEPPSSPVQRSNPPSSPAQSSAPPRAPAQQSDPLLPAIDDDEDDERPGFNPFKFQRITVPPGLRADMIRWSREGKAEQPPEGSSDGESNLESATAESGDADDPGSVMPVGGSGAPRLPLRSVRGVALAAFLVILPLAVLGLASAVRKQPDTSTNAPDAAPQQVFGSKSEAASPAPQPLTREKRAPAATATATTAGTPVTATTTAATATSAAPPSTAVAPPRATSPSRPIAGPARPSRTAEPAPTATPNEQALDRPFSLPK